MTRASDRLKRMRAKVILAAEGRTFAGIPAETVRDIIAKEIAAPMRAGATDLQHNGLFGDAHKQQELFR